MKAGRILAALGALLFCAVVVRGQAPLDRARKAILEGDRAAARSALLEVLATTGADRASVVARSLTELRDAGAVDVWLEAAESWSTAHADDALVSFYRGVGWQGLSHLSRAEQALGQARAKAPDDPALREALVWNAVRRFDARAVLERSEGAKFAGVEALRAQQEARLHSEPKGMVALVGIFGVVLLAATIVGLGRMGRRPQPAALRMIHQ